DEEQDVPDAGDEERLLRRRGGLRLVVPESDEQVGAEAHDFPEDQKLQEVVRADGPEHPGREEADLRVVTRLAFLLVHVAEGIDENQEAEERHEDEHQRAEVVDQERDPDLVSGDAREPDVSVVRLRREAPSEGALGEDLAARISTVGRERDEVEDRGVQDDRDRHQHDDRVPPREDAVETDAQQGPGEQELVFQANQGPTCPGSSIFARYTPPIIAAARRTALRMIVIGKASKNRFAIQSGDVAFGSYTGREVGDCGQLTGPRKETAMTPNKAATARTTENSRRFIPAPPAPARP